MLFLAEGSEALASGCPFGVPCNTIAFPKPERWKRNRRWKFEAAVLCFRFKSERGHLCFPGAEKMGKGFPPSLHK